MVFTKKRVSEITGLTPRQVQFYTEEGLVSPVESGGGRGRFRRYSKGNLLDLLVVQRLFSRGMTVGKIKSVIGFLHEFPFENMKEYYETAKTFLLIYTKDGREMVEFKRIFAETQVLLYEKDLAEKYGDSIVVINFGKLAGEVDAL
jgi:DNA-binding transcriptional MerR regulator